MDPNLYETPRRRPVDELPLFAAPSVPVDTSEAAADAVRTRVQRLHALTRASLMASGGQTCDELCRTLNVPGNTMRPRLWELEGMGHVMKTTRKRRTESGSLARVYELTGLGAQSSLDATQSIRHDVRPSSETK